MRAAVAMVAEITPAGGRLRGSVSFKTVFTRIIAVGWRYASTYRSAAVAGPPAAPRARVTYTCPPKQEVFGPTNAGTRRRPRGSPRKSAGEGSGKTGSGKRPQF